MAKKEKDIKKEKAVKKDSDVKKKKKKAAPQIEEELPENALPQNILPMGERVEENKNIYISQGVYKKIHKFTRNKTVNESGGMLIGTVVEELGKTNILISGFVEAKYCDATPTTLKFTHETWEYVHKEIEKKYSGKKIVGWIHTHPDFGIFLSEYDKFIQENFFSDDHQVAYVVDPIQEIEGFYFWINGSLEKCKGFYIYEKTGTPIELDNPKVGTVEETPAQGSVFTFKNVLIGLLTVAVVFLMFSHISLSNQLKELNSRQEKLENQQLTLTTSANQALGSMQGYIYTLQEDFEALKTTLIEKGILPEEKEETDKSDSTDTTENTGTTDTTENKETGNE